MLPKANSFNPHKLTPGFKCNLLFASYRQKKKKKWHRKVKDLIQGHPTC